MRAAALALAVVVGLAVTPAAAAKENVVAKLYEPALLGAKPGREVLVTFALHAVLQDGSEAAFSATGIFVRVRAAETGRWLETGAELTAFGSFLVRFQMPRGGIDDLVIGLPGTTSGPSGTRRSDLLFRIVNDPFPLTYSEPAAHAWPRSITIALIAALLAFSCVVLAIARRRGRGGRYEPPAFQDGFSF